MSVKEIIPPGMPYPPDFGSPTSLAMRAGDFVYVSGMIAWDKNRNIIGIGDPRAQTIEIIKSIQACLKEAGGDLSNIVKVTFYLTDIRHKAVIWEARKEFFASSRPASTLVEVTHLVDPLALLEVDAVAYMGK
jgi:enamine deaminase RidA (YjgF/YER057c/UK114 family)